MLFLPSEMEGHPKTLDEATDGGPDEAAFWLTQIRDAAKVEEDWRKRAELLVERYRDEKRGSGTVLNIFWSNIQLLKPSVFSATPAPDVRRRNIAEDPATRVVGRGVAEMLERGLSYAVDAWDFDPPMKSVRDDSLIVGRGVSREVYDVELLKRRDVQSVDPLDAQGPRAPQDAVNYHSKHKTMSDRCRACDNYRTPGACAIVEGKIDPNGHCDMFVDRPDGMPASPRPPMQYQLDGQPVEPETDAEGPFVEQKAEEKVETRYVFWNDFRMSPSRQWSDVWWVAFRHPMTRDDLKDEFGEAAGNKVKLTIGQGSNPSGDENKGPKDPEHAFDRAEVWEVWNKRKRERVWVATGYRSIIRKDPDPLNLAGFFPMPRPLYAVETTDTMVPVPEFCLYQDQADELDEVQDRVRSLTRVLKAVNVVDGDFSEILSVATATDGDNIPIQRPATAAEDLQSSIWPWPIQNIIQVILGLVQRSEQLRQFIYEITGLSDLTRGATKERESATAQRLKGQYGAVRMTPRSQPMHEHVRDALRIKAEIMAEMFDPETLTRISGIPATPEMIQLLRDERLRNTNIEVATDSTIRPDKIAEKEEAVEYVGAVMGFLQAVVPIVSNPAGIVMVPLLMEILKAATKPYKFGRQLEEQLEQTTDGLSQLAQQQIQQQVMAQQQAGAIAQQQAMMPPEGAPQATNGMGQ